MKASVRETKNIDYEDIGKVEYIRKTGVRGIRITIKPNKPVTVTLPVNMDWQRAISFVDEKRQWIKSNRERLQKKVKAPIIISPDNLYHTHYHKLEMIKVTENKINFKINNGKMMVHYPENTNWENERIQAFLKKSILYVLQWEAKEYLPKRTMELAAKFQLKVGKVSVRQAHTRWGSCSSKNDISLNVHLMRLPTHLIDHVILHELAHTQEKNHAKSFYSLLEKLDPLSDKHDKELKNYTTFF
jgi:predicted metal-dependent hydrolase